MKSNCDLCERASYFHKGLIGKHSNKRKIMFIAHKPDSRVKEYVLPGFNSYEVVLPQTKTGKNMIALLDYCNFKFEDIFWTNLFKCVLPGDRDPSKKEYAHCLEKKLTVQIRDFDPKFIVALGSQVYKNLFPEKAKEINHENIIGEKLEYKGIKTLIFPHPQKIAPPYCNLKRKGELFVMVNDFLNG